MSIYLVRHAHAVDASEDELRPLSPFGEQQVRVLSAFLRRSNQFKPGEFWHSPLVRSRQTAEQLMRGLGSEAPLTLVPHLEPDDDPRLIADRIKAATRSVAVVGHEPHLSALATFLLTGKTAPAVFLLQKSALIALDGIGAYWQVRWHLSPELIA